MILVWDIRYQLAILRDNLGCFDCEFGIRYDPIIWTQWDCDWEGVAQKLDCHWKL